MTGFISYYGPGQQDLLQDMLSALKSAEKNGVIGSDLLKKYIPTISFFQREYEEREFPLDSSNINEIVTVVSALREAVELCIELPKKFREKGKTLEHPIPLDDLNALLKEIKGDLNQLPSRQFRPRDGGGMRR